MNAPKPPIVGWVRTDDRELPDDVVITSSTDPSTIDTGDWKAVHGEAEGGDADPLPST